MYDTTNCFLPKEKIGRIDLLNEVPKYLTGVSQHYFEKTNSYAITGYNGSLKISISEQRVSIKDNSISKWYLGDNIQTLTRGDTQRAFEKLSDDLHLPISDAHVTKIDIAANLLMNHEPSVYFQSLGMLKHYKRNDFNTGLYYTNSKGVLNFYDKIIEAKKKQVEIPSLYHGKNLLRYERRFNRKLCKQFNRPELLVSDLYDNDFYMGIIDRFVNDYLRISKIREINKFDYNMVRTKTDLYNQTILLYIESRGGLLNVLDEVEQAQKLGNLTRKQAYDLRSRYREASENKLFTDDNELAKELTEKVKSKQRYYH